MEKIIQEMVTYHCPRWEELPQLALYIDQVVLYLQENLSVFDSNSAITPAMINNYVKQKIVPPPVKKKYGREHLAYFFVIFTMKRVTSISQLGRILRIFTERYSSDVAYNQFCAELEYALKSTFCPEQFPPVPYQQGAEPALSVLRAMTVTFAHMILIDRLELPESN